MADDIAQTYAALRIGMVLVALLLFAAVVVEMATGGLTCLLPSISAYYYTPARPALVGGLCAIGAALVVYRGRKDVENVLLDFAGFTAFVVAFVPTRFDDRVCGMSTVPSAAELSAAVRNNVTALLVVTALAVAVAVRLPSRRYADAGGRLSWPAWASLALSLAGLVASGVFFAIAPAAFERIGHELAATALFLLVLAVMIVNAWIARRPYRARYVATAAGTTAGAAALLVAGRLGFAPYVFWLEATLIGGFAVFWMVQTAELRGSAPALLPADRRSPPDGPTSS